MAIRRPRVQVVTPTSPLTTRRTRSPRHHFSTSQQPYEIRPFMVAPVLPGDTMKNLSLQASAWSGLLWEHHTGWHSEVFFFYVKHRDLAERDLLTDMHVKNVTDASLNTAADPLHYHAAGINWSKLCMIRVVEEYFRNEGEPWDLRLSASGLPLASINQDDFLDSALRDGAVDSSDLDQLPDEEKEQALATAHEVIPGFEDQYEHWLTMRRMNLIAVDFDDYLKANGIRVPREDVNPHRPELLRYVRDFQKPKRAISPLGEEAVKLGWEWKETADKDRLFKEPGFICGYHVIRPKVYRNLRGSAAGLMNDAFTWLPALMSDNPETSLRVIPAATAAAMFGQYNAANGDIIMDMKDLFLYGEQYLAGEFFDLQIQMDLGPDPDFDRRYPTSDFASDVWFTTSSSAPPETYVLPPAAFMLEGVVKLDIASRVTDTSGHGGQSNPGVV